MEVSRVKVWFPYHVNQTKEVDTKRFTKINNSYTYLEHPDDHARCIVELFRNYVVDHVTLFNIAGSLPE